MRCWKEVRESVVEVNIQVRAKQLICLIVCVCGVRELTSYVVCDIILLHVL